MKPRFLKSTLLSAVTIGALSLVGPGLAHATPINWLFYNTPINGVSNGNLNTSSASFSSDNSSYPMPVTATGFVTNTSGSGSYYSKRDLYEKTPLYGTQEAGLGLAHESSSEIVPNTFIQLDISKLSVPPLTQLAMTFQSSSTTGGDAYQIWGTNMDGGMLDAALSTGNAVSLGGGSTQNDITLSKNVMSLNGPVYKYIDVTATSGTVLIHKIDSTVPEPASLALFGMGLVGLSFRSLRKRRPA